MQDCDTTGSLRKNTCFVVVASSLSGHEAVGVVAAIGKKAKEFKTGERVVADNLVRKFCCFGNRV